MAEERGTDTALLKVCDLAEADLAACRHAIAENHLRLSLVVKTSHLLDFSLQVPEL